MLKIKKRHLSKETLAAEAHFKQKKIKVCLHLKSNLDLSKPEHKFWFAVLERAIKDIGKWDLRHVTNGHKGVTFDIPIYNTDSYFTLQDFYNVCDFLDTSPSYVLKIIHRANLLPRPDDYYNNLKSELGL